MFLMTIAALIFVVGFIVILLLLSARSPVSARLMAVTSQTQATQAEVSPMGQRQPVSLEQLANALGPVRKYLGFTKNPEITQRLAMAGYRKASHTDVFLLARMLRIEPITLAHGLRFTCQVEGATSLRA